MIIQLQLHISDCKANIRFTADGWIGQIGTICVALIVVTSCNTTFSEKCGAKKQQQQLNFQIL